MDDKQRYISKDPEKRAKQLANLKYGGNFKHGGFQRSKRNYFDQEEEALFDEMRANYIETYQLSKPAEIDLLEMAVKSYIKQLRIDRYEKETGKPVSDRAKDHGAQFLEFIKALGLDRRFELSVGNAENAQKVDLALLFQLNKSKESDANDTDQE